MATMDGVQRSTGRTRQEWFRILDSWGASGRPYREIAAWLTGEHGLSKWWAQKLIVEYEQERGTRAPGVRRDGTFEVGASKTVDAPVGVVYQAFVDGRKRRGWLRDGKMSLRASQEDRSARFDWDDGSTRVNATFAGKGPSKATVAVAHARLPDLAAAAQAKAMWKERLAALASFLEA